MSKWKLGQPFFCRRSTGGHKPGLRDDCPGCNGSPLQRRCIICLQPPRDVKRFPTKCIITDDEKHVVPVKGYGARCQECGEEPFGTKVGEPTDCSSSSGHMLMNYPFRCEACTLNIKIENMSSGCQKTYTGEHQFPYRKLELDAAPKQKVPDYGDSSRKLIEIANKRSKLWRVRHAKS